MAYFRCKGQFKGFIDIYSTANATVTASTTGHVRSATCDASGYARIKVNKKGNYQVTSTGTSRIAHATVIDKTPVTAVYTWQKWDSQLYYYQTYSDVGGTGYKYIRTNIATNLYARATAYSFNESNGVYSFSGGIVQQFYRDGTVNFATRTAPYCSLNASTSCGEMVEWMTSSVGYNVDGKIDTLGSLGRYIGTSGNARVWGSSASYRKGTTQYANATATTLDALPQNGRNTGDGYWYIAV